MKKFMILFSICLFKQVIAIEPTCGGAINTVNLAQNLWNNQAALIYNYWLPWLDYDQIKMCALNHDADIPYSIDDLLGSQKNNPYGIVDTFSTTPNSPQASFDLSETNILISGNDTLPNVNLAAPAYYLHKNQNKKIAPDSRKRGIFRFYTLVIGGNNVCRSDWGGRGFELIREHWFESFFKKITVNGKPTSLDNSGNNIAEVIGVELNHSSGSSKIIADVHFVSGREVQRRFSNGTRRKICAIDVYAELQLRPESSPNFSQSGQYNLTFKIN